MNTITRLFPDNYLYAASIFGVRNRKKTIRSLVRFILPICVLITIASTPAYSQLQWLIDNVNVGILVRWNTTPTLPPCSIADMDVSNTASPVGGKKGFLIPRNWLNTAINISSPIFNPDNSLFIYNLASTIGPLSTVSQGLPINIIQGFYYYDQDPSARRWQYCNSPWLSIGNGGTPGNGATFAPNNFVGTVNDETLPDRGYLVLKTNSLERMRVLKNGQIGIGTPIPLPGCKLDVNGVIRSSALGQNIVMSNIDGVLFQSPGNTGDILYMPGIWQTAGVASSDDWSLTGDKTGGFLTSEATDFVGTTDSKRLNFAVDGSQAGRIDYNFAIANTFFGYKGGLGNIPTGTMNTAYGYQALLSYSTGYSNTCFGSMALYFTNAGRNNTAIGSYSLSNNKGGLRNVAIGSEALRFQISGNDNVAVGYQALKDNTSHKNTAIGSYSSLKNTTGLNNTSIGYNGLFWNKKGSNNTASGAFALLNITESGINISDGNTAIGCSSLFLCPLGDNNTAIGQGALQTCGSDVNNNTAVGDIAMANHTQGNDNTAIGKSALASNVTGGNNIAIGVASGPTGFVNSNTISIGKSGVYADATTHIANIYTTAVTTNPVKVINSNLLGASGSSRKFKTKIENMGATSDDLFGLRPVTFHYKKREANGSRPLQYGLIAEEVEKINPGLVVYDDKGLIYSVHYETLTPMILNEMQKEHAIDMQQEEELDAMQQEINRIKAEQEHIAMDDAAIRSTMRKVRAIMKSLNSEVTNTARRVNKTR